MIIQTKEYIGQILQAITCDNLFVCSLLYLALNLIGINNCDFQCKSSKKQQFFKRYRLLHYSVLPFYKLKFDTETLIVPSKKDENSKVDILGQSFGNFGKDGKFWTMKCKLCYNSIKSKQDVISNFLRYAKVGKSNI